MEIWYTVELIAKEMEPTMVGPTRVVDDRSTTVEGLLAKLQSHIIDEWQMAMKTGRLWDYAVAPEGFLLVNPEYVIGVAVRVVPDPGHGDAPDQGPGASS